MSFHLIKVFQVSLGREPGSYICNILFLEGNNKVEGRITNMVSLVDDSARKDQKPKSACIHTFSNSVQFSIYISKSYKVHTTMIQ